MKTLSLLVVATVGLAACQDAPVSPPSAPDVQLSVAPGAEAELIPGQYIIVFNDGVADAPGLARRLAAAQGASVRFTYQHAIKGFAANMSDRAAQALARNPNVAYVEQDQVVRASTTQTGATWGIDRIDQRALPLSTSFTYGNTGAGVTAYIIDTGIRFGHAEFGVRATSGFDAVDGGTADDCNGHGTHVAGTVGGTAYGVAKAANLVAVRVLDCGGSGSWSGVIAGIDWVTGNHVKPAVANMSLGGGASTSVDDAVKRSIAVGVSYAIAAGNGNMAGMPQNACNYSPARVPDANTVGSTTKSDTESSFSNYGTCVDILAPGSGITSAWHTSATATNTISGTSMATPHVAGVAALYLQSNPTATPAAVSSALVSTATTGAISLNRNSRRYGTPNRLLFTSH